MSFDRLKSENASINKNEILDEISRNECLLNSKYKSCSEIKKAIKIYERNISKGIVDDSYEELIYTYRRIGKYDKAIKVAKEAIDVFSKNDEPTYKLEVLLDDTILIKNSKIYMNNSFKGQELHEKGEIDKAIEVLNLNVKMDKNRTDSMLYYYLARLYHYKKDFEKEKEMYQYAVEAIQNGGLDYGFDFQESLNNVETFLDTGKWKYDCLPSDPKSISYQIKEAKKILKFEDRKKGIAMLEEIMENGTYNNTVYFTLYKKYNEDKQYDNSIRVCEKAIEVLGFFDKDREEKWNKYLDKSIEKKKIKK